MLSFQRIKNRVLAKLNTRFPYMAKRFTDAYSPLKMEDAPWTLVRKALADSKVAVVTTAGVHPKGVPPFDMNDPDGDPTFRVIDMFRPVNDLMITHDYYDHSDADKDINIVFPIERLWEFEYEGIVGQAARYHYGFMGHIVNRHIQTLIRQNAPGVAQQLKADAVDVALLTPG